MSLKIKWTPKAKNSLERISKYIEAEWGIAVKQGFLEKLKDFLDLLSNFPKLGSVEIKEKDIRGFILTKQITLYYRIKNDNIVILGLFDTRQDPTKRLE